MKTKIDLVGKVFGDLTVIKDSGNKIKSGDTYWTVVCVCGTEKEILGSHLRRHETLNCGCKLKQSKYDYLIGQRVGTYKVIERKDSTQKDRTTKYICECDCGKITNVPAVTLARGDIKSCVDCMRGDLHPMWRGGISSTYNRHHGTNEWRLFKESIVKKFGEYRCLKCRASYTKENRLEIHHIYSFVGYPEMVIDIDNAAILCQQCHFEFHRQYKKGNNTVEQFQEFMQLRAIDSCEIRPVVK